MPEGQALEQMPHTMHFVVSTTILSSTWEIASKGQAERQTEHLEHSSSRKFMTNVLFVST